MTGIHRKNPDLSICVPGCYITVAPLDNNWEETLVHSAEEREIEGTTNGGRHQGGKARKPLTIWHILHMPSHRFKHSAGGQTQTNVNIKSGLYNSDKGWICWRTAAYYMTLLCSAGCFCYYWGNDMQWTGTGARGLGLQLKEWITAVRMNPNSSSLFHNLKISWGFGVSGKPSWERAATACLMLFFSSSTWFFSKDQTAPFQHRICPISEQNQLGVVTPSAHKDPVKGSGGGIWHHMSYLFPL